MKSVSQKYCTGCKQWKSLVYFGKNKTKQDGINQYCKKCAIEKSNKYRARNPEKVKEYSRSWYENNKEYYQNRYKENKKQYQERTRQWRANPLNMNKVLESNRKWISRNTERAKSCNRRWKKENQERVLEHNRNRRSQRRGCGGKISSGEWVSLCSKYGNRCINPSCPNPSQPVTLDHVIPLKLGGKNVIDNAQPLCQHCNSSKGIKIIDYRYL